MNSNTIVMRLLEKEVARSRGLFQYDYGQRLVFTGVELPDAYEVHFSNNKVGVSKTVIGDATGVDIPDEFLLKGDPVYVWVFLHTGDADGETEYHGVIDVIKRAKPVHDKPTPVQQDEITQAIAVLNAAVTTTGQDVVDTTEAKDAAEAAQAAAEEAQGIAEGARDEAVQVKNEAVSAAEAAEAAKDAAVEAKETSEEIAEALPGTIEAALQEAKDSGEFDGATFVPSIDDGVISWTNDRQLPNPEPVDIAEELELDTYAKKDEIPTKVSELTNDSGYLTTETDPTVSSWAKQPNKPSYTAQEVGAIDVAQKGAANGVAELDADGRVKSGQLPSYVDDVAEYDSMSQFPATGESGKIYIAKDTNITYRWGGSSYVPIGSDLALGETASTAYRGDRGKIAYDHASAKGNAYANGLYKIATNAEGHVTGATPVAKSDITGLGIPGSVPTKTSELQNDSGFITTETDPTVASWAKEPTKPTYTASEVGLGNVANERQYSANNPPPADATKQNKINVNGILKGTGNGGVTAAVEGTDYINGDLIAVQDETPTDPNTQIWLPETQPESVQVASYAELTDVLNALNQSNAATNSDIGKAHSPKTVVDGKVTEWQYVEVGGGGGGSVDPEDIAEAVDAWCDENITNPSNPPLDRSLSLENAAAPADLVGDIINERKVVTDVKYNPEDAKNYTSVESASSYNQYVVVIAPNETGKYFAKSVEVKILAGEKVKFSVFKIEPYYTEAFPHKKFVKLYDITVITADNNGVARLELDTPILLSSGETVLVATAQLNHFKYGTYVDALYTIWEYGGSWYDLKPGEYYNKGYTYQVSAFSPYYSIDYVLEADAEVSNKTPSEILQKNYYVSPYDGALSEESENAVQNKTLYGHLISKDQYVVNDEQTVYLSGGKYDLDGISHLYAMSCDVPTYGEYSVSKIEVRATDGKTIVFGLWEIRLIGTNQGYYTLKQDLGSVVASNTRATITFQTPVVVDGTKQRIIATCVDQAMGYRLFDSNPNPYKHARIPTSLFRYQGNEFSSVSVGTEVNVYSNFEAYRGWEYPWSGNAVGAYEITYTPTVPETITKEKPVIDGIQDLENSAIGSLRGKVWYCAGDSTTYGIENGISYAQIIAERNGMVLWKDGISGSTLTAANDSKKLKAFSFDRYLNIPENVDFVTIWFGINDNSLGYSIGEISSDDETTFYGAYNKVLTWIINNRPNARIGLVVSHQCGNMATAIRNIAKKYGVLTFDMENDPAIPFWHPTFSYYANDVDQAVKTLRISQWWYESGNCVHPITAGYEAISYSFESWMRRL